MTLPQVSTFGAAESALSGAAPADNLSTYLLPDLNEFKEFVKKAAREQRRLESQNSSRLILPGCEQNSNQDSNCVKSIRPSTTSMSATSEVWGDPRNGRSFELTPSGCAFYQVKAGETLKAIIGDVLSESRKQDSSFIVNYESTRKAMNDILMFNNISDPDLIEPDSTLIIPSNLVPLAKRAA